MVAEFMENSLNHPVPKYFRVVYSNDLVPRVPFDNKLFGLLINDKFFPNKHFGDCLYYDNHYIEQVCSVLLFLISYLLHH